MAPARQTNRLERFFGFGGRGWKGCLERGWGRVGVGEVLEEELAFHTIVGEKVSCLIQKYFSENGNGNF